MLNELDALLGCFNDATHNQSLELKEVFTTAALSENWKLHEVMYTAASSGRSSETEGCHTSWTWLLPLSTEVVKTSASSAFDSESSDNAGDCFKKTASNTTGNTSRA